MSREILFKAKRIDNGEWVEGALFDGIKDCVIGRQINFSPYYENECKIVGYKVDRNTLCQYTGLTDKNGKKIWENDIVKYHFGEDVATIKFGKYQNCFDMQISCHVGFFVDWQRTSMRKDLGYWVEMIDCNVLGNIFDNPELLRGE